MVYIPCFFYLLRAPSANRVVESDSRCCLLDWLKAAIKEKHTELITRNVAVFHQDNVSLRVPLQTGQKVRQLDLDSVLHLLHSPCIYRITSYFNPYKSFLKWTCKTTSVRKMPTSAMPNCSGTKWHICGSN